MSPSISSCPVPRGLCNQPTPIRKRAPDLRLAGDRETQLGLGPAARVPRSPARRAAPTRQALSPSSPRAPRPQRRTRGARRTQDRARGRSRRCRAPSRARQGRFASDGCAEGADGYDRLLVAGEVELLDERDLLRAHLTGKAKPDGAVGGRTLPQIAGNPTRHFKHLGSGVGVQTAASRAKPRTSSAANRSSPRGEHWVGRDSQRGSNRAGT